VIWEGEGENKKGKEKKRKARGKIERLPTVNRLLSSEQWAVGSEQLPTAPGRRKS
jgi:hypothetical protein